MTISLLIDNDKCSFPVRSVIVIKFSFVFSFFLMNDDDEIDLKAIRIENSLTLLPRKESGINETKINDENKENSSK